MLRAIADFDAARNVLISKTYSHPVDVNTAAIGVVLAARLQAIEEALNLGICLARLPER